MTLSQTVMNKLLLFATLYAVSLTTAFGADPRQELRDNPYLSGSNLLAYPDKDLPELTPSPDGYVPFHIEHYARHGSRWLLKDRDYTRPVEALEKAEKAGVLTPDGKELLGYLRIMERDARDHYGDLTDVGAEQHRGIAERMYHNFPTVFADSAHVNALSTVVVRCILSMNNELITLQQLNPSLRINFDSSKANQWFLQNADRDTVAHRIHDQARPLFREFRHNHSNHDRFIHSLISDRKFIKTAHIDKHDLFARIFELANSIKNHKYEFELHKFFTEDELYEQWLCQNVNWYISSGNAPCTFGRMPFSQCDLTLDFINSADRAIKTGDNSATLRFGHDSVVMPLVVFLEMNDYNVEVEDLEKLADKWQNYRIYPMACNIQMIFYRNASKPEDILVKALLNEHEVRLPVNAVSGPYYKWSDVRQYYLDKVASFKSRFKE